MKFLVSIDIICFTVMFYCIIMFLFYYISIIRNNLFHYDIFTHLHNAFSSCALPTAPSCPPPFLLIASLFPVSYFTFFFLWLNFIEFFQGFLKGSRRGITIWSMGSLSLNKIYLLPAATISCLQIPRERYSLVNSLWILICLSSLWAQDPSQDIWYFNTF